MGGSKTPNSSNLSKPGSSNIESGVGGGGWRHINDEPFPKIEIDSVSFAPSH